MLTLILLSRLSCTYVSDASPHPQSIEDALGTQLGTEQNSCAPQHGVMASSAQAGEAMHGGLKEASSSADWPTLGADVGLLDQQYSSAHDLCSSAGTAAVADSRHRTTASRQQADRAVQLKELTVLSGLRPLCRKYGLHIAGSKAKLVQRILKHEFLATQVP